MYKVLIVEDEILARVGLRKLIDWENRGFCLLPDAKDGEEALAIITQMQPDIILLDLNIPKVNGLQILQFLKERGQTRCRVIIVSCHEEFDMVKEAMRLGAYEYLRKYNLSSEELTGILERCQQEFELYEGKIRRPPAFLFREIRFEELISDNDCDIFPDMPVYHEFLCILAQDQCGQNTVWRIAEQVCQWLREWNCKYLQILKNGSFCYFLFENCPQEGFYQKLLGKMREMFPIRIYLGVCRAEMPDAKEILTAMSRAEQISIASYYDEEEQLYFFEEKILLTEQIPRQLRMHFMDLKASVEIFGRSESEKIVRMIFRVIRTEKYIRVNVLRRYFMDMLGIYSMVARTLNRAIEEIVVWEDNCHYQRLMMLGSLQQTEEWFIEFNGLFHERFLAEYKSSQSDILKNAFTYIDQNLTGQIKLAEAAREIGVSGAYLSTIFKKEMGQNFIEYANRRKVDMAKKLLEDGKLVYEVSEQLGFENSTYFSKVFKRYEGVSPDSYRRK